MTGPIRLLFALLLFALPLSAMAQAPATLVADRISIDGDRVLVAEGAVEMLYE